MPIYRWLDQNKILRGFAEKYIYQNPQHADFFVTSVLLILNYSFGIGTLFYWQLTYGHLPWWLIAGYYFLWVGIGGRMMGGAYALAHKEVKFEY